MATFTILECLGGRETAQALDANGLPFAFASGDFAAFHAANLAAANGKKYRAAQVPDKDWEHREYERVWDGTYKRLPRWFPTVIYSHYAHHAKGEPGMIAYTEDATKGELDRQTRITARKYLHKLLERDQYSQVAVDEYIARWDDEYSPAPLVLSFATTPDEIEAVYCSGKPNGDGQHSPTSCMSYRAANYRTGGIHPTRVYGAGDLAVAYLMRGVGRITARAVCWPAKKRVSTIYGDAGRLGPLLDAAGYACNSDFFGARLLRMELTDGQFVAPYLDSGDSVRDNGEFLVIGDGNIGCDNTNGRSDEAVDGRLHCEDCGDQYDDDDINYVDCLDGHYCNTCEGRLTFTCEGSDETCAVSDRVVLEDGTEWSQSYFDDYGATCALTGEEHPIKDMVEMANGDYWSQASFDELGVVCADTAGNYPKSECVECDGDWLCREAIDARYPYTGDVGEFGVPYVIPSTKYTARLTDRDRARLVREGQLTFYWWLCRHMAAVAQSFYIPNNGHI